MIDDYPCGAVDVGFVFKPLPVAHLGTEPQKEQATSERRIIAQELADESQRGTSVRVSQLIDFFLYAHRIFHVPCSSARAYDHSVYLPCTSLRRFCGFSPFCCFVESITYVESIPPRGSTPTPGTSFFFLFKRLRCVRLRSLLPLVSTLL